MNKKKRQASTFMPGDSRYDKPVKYLRQHGAYLVTLQRKTPRQPSLHDVVPNGGDRAVPKGLVRSQLDGSFEAYLYNPAHSGSLLDCVPLADFATLEEAVAAVLDADFFTTVNH